MKLFTLPGLATVLVVATATAALAQTAPERASAEPQTRPAADANQGGADRLRRGLRLASLLLPAVQGAREADSEAEAASLILPAIQNLTAPNTSDETTTGLLLPAIQKYADNASDSAAGGVVVATGDVDGTPDAGIVMRGVVVSSLTSAPAPSGNTPN